MSLLKLPILLVRFENEQRFKKLVLTHSVVGDSMSNVCLSFLLIQKVSRKTWAKESNFTTGDN